MPEMQFSQNLVQSRAAGAVQPSSNENTSDSSATTRRRRVSMA